MKAKIICILVMMLLIGAGTIVVADWEVGDGHIMHHPQLPDPYGLDVNFHDWWLGDDWYSGDIMREVTDIHFWYSWKNDTVQDIPWIHVSIWSDNIGPPSTPLEELWNREFTEDEFVIAGPFGDGVQGWYHPPDIYIPDEHEDYYQINILNILDPFEQQAGETYWLVIQMPYYSIPGIGWKTTLDNYRDNAVYGTPTTGWEELWDPRNPVEEIDFAFVVNGLGPRPRVACEGIIEWLDVKPEDFVHETFGVANNGDTGSLLNWHIDSYPTWGAGWTFNPSSGTNLAVGDSVTVNVSCYAPSQPNEQFTGFIQVFNSDDASDYCTVQVTCITPRNKAIPSPFLNFLQSHPNMFPILQLFIQRLGLQ
jgi:hypothetical protein